MPEETSLDHCVEAWAGVWGPCSLDKATSLDNLIVNNATTEHILCYCQEFRGNTF